MKSLLFCTLFLSLVFSQTGLSQSFSLAKTLEKAKREGVTPAELDFYIKREKARSEHKGAETKNNYQGSYTFLHRSNTGLAKTASSTCGNIDFEDMSYAGWNIFKGFNSNSLNPPDSVVVYSTPSISGLNDSLVFHAIVDSANSRYFSGKYSFLAMRKNLSSNYSGKNIARINHKGAMCGVGILEKQLVVAATNPYLNFSYYVLLQNAGHTLTDQPYFSFKLIDGANNIVPGTNLKVIADSATPNPGFFLDTLIESGNPYYPAFFVKPWTPVSIDMSAYIGQTVTLQFIVADCAMIGHGAHAYIDFDCGIAPSGGALNTWPGDANYDLKVDFLDIFYVGAAYGYTGTPRTVQGNTWASLMSNNWNSTSLYLVNAKHADCDGDGLVSLADTTAISQNYGQGHAFKTGPVELATTSEAAMEDLKFSSADQIITADMPFELNFELGSSANTVDDIYALGFTINYPGYMMDNRQTIVDCNTSVLGPANDILAFKKMFGDHIDLAITKTDHINRSNVSGSVFSLKLHSAPIIYADSLFTFMISNVVGITATGKKIPFNAIDTLQVLFVEGNAVGVQSNNTIERSVVLYPNPAKNELTIQSTGKLKIKGYKIISVLGSIVRASHFSEQNKISISELQEGAYVVKIELEDGQVINKRFIKN